MNVIFLALFQPCQLVSSIGVLHQGDVRMIDGAVAHRQLLGLVANLQRNSDILQEVSAYDIIGNTTLGYPS